VRSVLQCYLLENFAGFFPYEAENQSCVVSAVGKIERKNSEVTGNVLFQGTEKK
jgi:hypothetical protein